jgi:hypothetical protein
MNVLCIILLAIIGYISMGIFVFVLKELDNNSPLYLSGRRSIINHSIVGIISLAIVISVCVCIKYLGNL